MPIYTFECETCGKLIDRAYPSWEHDECVECDCGGQAPYSFGQTHRTSRVRAGDPWMISGGFAGEGEGSISRAIPADMVPEYVAHDKAHGLGGVNLEYKVDPNKPSQARPSFRSLADRRRWDKAHGWRDADSYV